MIHCAWCGKELQGCPKRYLWVDQNFNTINTHVWGATRIPFCSEECKEAWKNTKWIDQCIVCGKTIKSEAPGNKEITRNEIIFYACPNHKDMSEQIESLIDIALQDIGDDN